MNLRMFSHRGSNWTFKLDVKRLEQEIATWLASSSSIKIREIRHDVISGFWMPPQLIVSIYFER